MVTALETPETRVRRTKLRPPRFHGLVSRPRLTARLDQSLRMPVTLVAAPSGFGKTTLLAQWAETQPGPLAWLNLDASDRGLKRFVTHLVAAIETLAPGVTLPVLDGVRQPHQGAPAEIGSALADQLLDLPRDVVLVLDDYQLAASTEVEALLAALLRLPPPAFHLVLATRSDPALPLARMRLHGQVNELRARDLRFDDDEAGQLLAALGRRDGIPEMVSALQQQVEGWIAGLRLATLVLPAVSDPARVAEVVASDRHLMDFLVEEVLAIESTATQDFLLRAAIVDRVSASLADALTPDAIPAGGSSPILERLAHDSLFLDATDDDAWYRYHPLFRGLLLHQLGLRCSPAEIAVLHIRASDWFAAHDRLDAAIRHRMLAGDAAGAAALVERHVLPALNREDWNAVAAWLRMLPEDIVQGSPRLLLAKGWVSHFSGRSVPIRAMMAELDALLAGLDDAAARSAFAAERDALIMAANFSSGRDRDAAVVFAQLAAERVPPDHRLAAGLTTFALGCALHASGRTDDALRFLTAAAEREEERVDAGSIRALGGLMFVHRQAGNARACEEVTQHLLALADRHDLPVATGWGRWELGWLAYGRDELDRAIELFSAIVADAGRVHLHCACEAMFGLALAYQAKGLPADVASITRRLMELILDANALEYLPLARAFEARLDLLRGETERAIAWLEWEDGVSIESTALDAFDHPYLTRVKVLLAAGLAPNLDRASQAIGEFLATTEARCQGAHRAEALALSAMVLDAQGQPAEALATMRRSVEHAASSRGLRTFRDLGAGAASLLARLAAHDPGWPFLQELAQATGGSSDPAPQTPPPGLAPLLETLTAREAEVLAGLARRLSYQEIGDELFISMETVKSHAANIYGKFGVRSRREALDKAVLHGWVVPN